MGATRPRRPRTVPRKAPHQERARATVEAILAATAHVLVKDGYDRASTNRIAEVAGVSIGSLYQYFPSKEALVAALVDRHMTEMIGVFDETVLKVAGEPIEVAARELVRAMIDAHGVDPRLHKILAEQVPRAGRMQRLNELERYAASRLRPYLEARESELQVESIDLAVFILVQLVEGTAHAAASDPELAFDKDALAEELTRVVVRYLVRR